MKNRKLDIPFINVFLGAIFASFLYYLDNLWFAAVSMIIFGVVYFVYSKKEYYYDTEEQKNRMIKFMFFSAIFFIAIRIPLVFSFAGEFVGDEWNDIVDYYRKIAGEKGFFEYSMRAGSTTSYFSGAVIALFMVIFRSNLDFLILIPLITSILTAWGFFELGKRMRNREFGVILLFVYSVSGWAFFISAQLMHNIYIPLFLVISMLIITGIKHERPLINALLLGLTSFFAFLAYASWILAVPFLLYVIFEYRKETGKKAGVSYAVAIFIALVAAALIYLSNMYIIKWVLGFTIIEKSPDIKMFILDIINIPKFFVKHLKGSLWFSEVLPLFTFAEAVSITGGIIIAVAGFKNRINRIVLVGFFISLTTLVITREIGHQLRHVFILPFCIMLSGIFIQKIISWKYLKAYMVILILFFSGVIMYQAGLWKYQKKSSTISYRIAKMINNRFPAGDYLYIHETIPYGDYGSFLRTKAAFNKNTGDIQTVIFLSSYHMKKYIKRTYKNVEMKLFYDYANPGRIPIAVFIINSLEHKKDIEFFVGLSELLKRANGYLWELQYMKAYETAGSQFNKAVFKDDRTKLKNTFIRFYQMETAIRGGVIENAVKVFEREGVHMYESADWHYYMGKISRSMNENVRAKKHFEKAMKLAPFWDAPKKAFFSK